MEGSCKERKIHFKKDFLKIKGAFVCFSSTRRYWRNSLLSVFSCIIKHPCHLLLCCRMLKHRPLVWGCSLGMDGAQYCESTSWIEWLCQSVTYSASWESVSLIKKFFRKSYIKTMATMAKSFIHRDLVCRGLFVSMSVQTSWRSFPPNNLSSLLHDQSSDK